MTRIMRIQNWESYNIYNNLMYWLIDNITFTYNTYITYAEKGRWDMVEIVIYGTYYNYVL